MTLPLLACSDSVIIFGVTLNVVKSIKNADSELDEALLNFYPTLGEEQVKQLVVDDKWMASIEKDIHSEMDRITQSLTQRIRELAERYEVSLPALNQQVDDLEHAVNQHLKKMGFIWN